MNKTVKEILIEARGIITNPKHWTTVNTIDFNAEGEPCYCALGALAKARGEEIVETAYGLDWKRDVDNDRDDDNMGVYSDLHPDVIALAAAAPEELFRDRPTTRVYVTNDKYGHEATLAMFDRAIANA